MNDDLKWRNLNALTLAYVGDATYEMMVRDYLVMEIGLVKVNQLHHQAKDFVSAKAQAKAIQAMLEENLLTEEEEGVYRRGRNASSHTKAKNADVVTYRVSTGFEAVFGYLHLTKRNDRKQELGQWAINYLQRSREDDQRK